jgi:uncharacterized protein YgiM (DUF1202 family)
MKKTLVLLLCLVFFSLACIWTASPMNEGLDDTPAGFILSTETATRPADVVIESAPTISPQICAVVIADQALHLRNGPSTNAGILTWLNRGDVVYVVDQLNGDWWRVRFGDVDGYARALYLEDSACAEEESE